MEVPFSSACMATIATRLGAKQNPAAHCANGAAAALPRYSTLSRFGREASSPFPDRSNALARMESL